MKLVTYNIHFAMGKDLRVDLPRVVEAVRGADVIALQEVERNYGPEGPPDQPAAIEALLPDYYWVYVPAFDVDASEKNDDGSVRNARRQHGVMILSKTPILSCRPVILPKIGFGDRFNMQMGALEGVIDGPAGPLRIYSVHLGYLDSDERQVQITHLLSAIEGAPAQGGAWSGPDDHREKEWSAGRPRPPMPQDAILLGDFNMEPDSPEYALLTGARDGQDAPAFRDAWAAAGNGAGNGAGSGITHPASAKHLPGRRIDYCFVSGALGEWLRACWVDEAAQGSDHQPFWIELKV